MKTYHNKVKIYVVIAILLIVMGVKFVADGLKQNMFYTPSSIIRSFKAWTYKNDFNKIASAVSSNTPLSKVDYNKSVPVIVYHGIPYSDMPNQFSISLDKFKDQLFSLKRAGYNTISTEDLYSYLRGEKNLPDKPILLTFDDGRIDSVELADPVLKALDYQATMFVIGRYSLLEERQKYYISTSRIKEMDASGRWDIQAHSYDGHNSYLTAPGQFDGHFFSHKEWLEPENRIETDEEFRLRIREDMQKVKTGLEKLINKPINSLAFPFGDFGQNNSNFQDARAINIEEGSKLFSIEFYQNDPYQQRYTNNYYTESTAGQQYFLVRRLDANSEWSGADFVAALDNSAAKMLPYSDDFTINKGWLTFWGIVNTDGGHLSIKAEPTETGGTILIDGSRLWKDYSVTATVSTPAKSNIYVWTRFIDDNNNAACNFGNGFIHIEQTINGKSNIIKGVIDKKITLPDGIFTIEAQVKGRTIRCILNGTKVVESNFLEEKLIDGGVGFKTWEATPGKANLIINNVYIQEI